MPSQLLTQSLRPPRTSTYGAWNCKRSNKATMALAKVGSGLLRDRMWMEEIPVEIQAFLFGVSLYMAVELMLVSIAKVVLM
uniref:Uncharacterized protein n=1 Tax=Fagus sylvatica TaxID=28930 RepID=A0A2N9HZP3_FAGSY